MNSVFLALACAVQGAPAFGGVIDTTRTKASNIRVRRGLPIANETNDDASTRPIPL
ncbi:hypothetical protein H8356DRAFT_1361432 [Neocallimastix lanati (nom. inval.)]|nr:hypothetical protein H8356DRAFT_1361432 [Neocallimastix sp. JGI-2020a]